MQKLYHLICNQHGCKKVEYTKAEYEKARLLEKNILPKLIEEKLATVKQHAQMLITTQYPLWKQVNMLTEINEINSTRLTHGVTSLDDRNKDKLAKYNVAKEAIENIRKKSNKIEMMVQAMDYEHLITFNASAPHLWEDEHE